jgi:hypothetical protein
MSSTPLTGYDHQFVEPAPDSLLCLIYLSVAREPQQVSCCGKVICRGCLEEQKKHSDSCPQCRKDIISFSDKRSKCKSSYSNAYGPLIGVQLALIKWLQTKSKERWGNNTIYPVT